nr:hypothetical protein [Tanacetum cinerariifolium]
MKHENGEYLTHTDYALWEVIVNDRRNELKVKSTLLLAIPDEHLLKFHEIKDAKTLWEAIKTRFGGNKESKKMQKIILKQQYENFAASRSEGLDKTCDSQLNKRDLNNKSDVFESAFNSSVNENEEDNNQANDRYKTSKGYHAVPPPYTGNFMPPRPDLFFAGLDDYVFKSAISETVTSVHETETSTSKTSKKSMEKPKTVRPSASIIEDWDSNSDDDCKVPVNAAKQSSLRAASSTSTARYVNTAVTRPAVNGVKPSSNIFHKSHSPVRRTFNQRTAPKNSDLKETVNIVKVNNVTTAGTKAVVSDVQGNRENAVKSLACWIWRPTINVIDHISKDNGSYMLKRFNYVDLQGRLKHMTVNKFFLTDYQEIDGGFVAFGESPKGGIENQINNKVKIIRCDNGTKYKNSEINQFCQIKREFSVARTPQQNGVAERKNRTLIEAARTMLEDSLLPTTFWVEAVNTACYIQNKVLVTKPHNKTPYELLIGRSPNLDFMKPFGCHVTILNTLDHLGKFKGKADKEFLVGYSINRRGPEWLFDIDSLTTSMHYEPVTSGNQTNNDADDKDADEVPDIGDEGVSKGSGIDDQEKTDSSTQDVNIATLKTDIFDNVYDNRDVGAEADTNNLELSTVFSLIPITRVQKDHTKEQIIGDLNLATQTRIMLNFSKENAMVIQALADPSWIEAMQEELFQFKLQKVWTLVDLPNGKRSIRTKWVFRNKKNERGIVVRNKARLVAQCYTQEEGIDYDEKSLYDEFEQMMHKRFQMSSIGELTFFLGLQVKQKDDGIFSNQDKYVADILIRFDFTTVKKAITPMEPNKALIKDGKAENIDVHLYRSMIGSLMYLIASRPDIMFAICACIRCQETMRGSITQIRSERVPTPPYNSPLLSVNTLGSDESSMSLQELMALCTTLSYRVLALETDLRQTKKTDVDWDDVQVRIQADEELAQKMLEEERESLSMAERAKLLAELIEKRKKLQAA